MAARLVLADDHSMFREALRDLLTMRMPEVQIVGEAGTGLETLRLCHDLKPDALVLDISMPDRGGLDLLEELKSITPETRVIIVSQYTDRAYVIRALRHGARGYVPKKALASDLVRAVKTVLGGRTYLDPAVADLVVDAAIHPDDQDEPQELNELTSREREILKMIAEGKTTKEIAGLLFISPHTVNRHRSNLMEKLELHTKSDLVKLAIRLKLIEP